MEVFEKRPSSNQKICIESKQPLLVISIGWHPKTSDIGGPAMIITPGLNQDLDNYKIVIPFGYDFYYVHR